MIADQIASAERLRGVTQVGRGFSPHASCIGRALPAQLPDEQVLALLPEHSRNGESLRLDRAEIPERSPQCTLSTTTRFP